MKKIVVLLFTLLFFSLFQIDVLAAESKKGIYFIDEFPKDKKLKLNGEWEFYWKQLYTPEHFKDPSINTNFNYVMIPNGPYGFDLGNGETSSIGYGTYRLIIKFPKEEIGTHKALHLPSIASAYTLWIDGKKMESNGKVGTSKKDMEPKYLKKIVVFPIESDTVEIVIQASNFHQRKAGIYTPIYLGERTVIAQYREKILIYRSLIVASFIIIGLYHLVLFLFHRKEKALFFFSCSVFFVALRTILLEDSISTYLLPFFSWNISSKLEYISFILGTLFFAYYIFTLYPNEVSKKIRNFITFICISYSLFISYSIYLATKSMVLLQTVGLFIMCYILFINVLAFIRKRDGSTLNVIGTIILLLAGINDILMYNGLLQTVELSSVGLVFFLFTQSIIISSNYSKAFQKSEKYAQQLATLNASLEEKVQLRTEQLKKTNTQLSQVNKKLMDVYESNKKLINNISHEIRSPLTIIQTYTKGMLDGVVEKNEEYLKLVNQKAIDLSKILDDLVSLSDLENHGSKFDFEKVEAQQYCRELYKKLNLVLKNENVNFTFINDIHKNHNPHYILIDRTRLEQVIHNLINNALRYIDDKNGKIIFRLNKRDDEHIVISIEDNGIGINENDIAYIFNRFYSRDSPHSHYHGAGLGLAISKEIVERHKGTIWVESVYGEGASFYIQLPIATSS